MPNTPGLLDVEAVAELLRCSRRHVYRLSDAGRMPQPVRLGALRRWSRRELVEWIDSRCSPDFAAEASVASDSVS